MEQTIISAAIQSCPVLLTLVLIGIGAKYAFPKVLAYHQDTVEAYQKLVDEVRKEAAAREARQAAREDKLIEVLKTVAKIG